ncbi:hypothetical protein Pcinc_043935 [Petrolisthes cinctipes]|uniref:Uncharacterized protein n=1 Tax=Petrolisthes cinctipes TaxID=88211 RepID=A0AAE1BFN0_PETCI|nr:hypothetical protein Pcinc_043935 [Petrolisthes cinctipes]
MAFLTNSFLSDLLPTFTPHFTSPLPLHSIPLFTLFTSSSPFHASSHLSSPLPLLSTPLLTSLHFPSPFLPLLPPSSLVSPQLSSPRLTSPHLSPFLTSSTPFLPRLTSAFLTSSHLFLTFLSMCRSSPV